MTTKTLIAIIGTLALFVQAAPAEEKTVIRFGHFPNITYPPIKRTEFNQNAEV